MLPSSCVDYINEEFGVPMEIDIEIGVSNNKMIELKHPQITDNVIECGFGGTKSSMEELCNRLTENGVTVSYEIEKEEEKILSIEGMFLTKSAYASDMGSSYVKLGGTMRMEFNV